VWALDGCRAAHARLLRRLDRLDDAAARRGSRLPGWTVGHVVTHVARNADSHVRMLRGAQTGEVVDQYEGGAEGRAADIAAGAGRPAAELVADLAGAIRRLEVAWERTSPDVWAHGYARMMSGELCPCADLPFRRWREVEVHHVDLGTGAEPVDWPTGYVDTELPRQLAELPERLTPSGRARLLAWLLGRADHPPELPPW
jgi:maleylpyruvate isomerase